MAIESGWVYDPVPKHVCIRPTQHDLEGHFEGAIWKCGDCGLFQELYWDTQDRRKDLRPLSPVDAEARIAGSEVKVA